MAATGLGQGATGNTRMPIESGKVVLNHLVFSAYQIVFGQGVPFEICLLVRWHEAAALRAAKRSRFGAFTNTMTGSIAGSMAKAITDTKTKRAKKAAPKLRIDQRIRRFFWRGLSVAFLFAVLMVVLGVFINPPTTAYMMSEGRRLGGVDYQWISIEEIAPAMVRSVVAAEDANFCNHWGFDLPAIKLAIAEGSNRGASTLSQQTVKNVYLWHGRSWIRKAMEALMTPLMEAVWPKRRILEVYLNVAEFDEGVFGVEAAARHYFKVVPAKLTETQAARLAAVLPSPKTRSASDPSNFVRKRASQVRDGAATISKDGRARCFES